MFSHLVHFQMDSVLRTRLCWPGNFIHFNAGRHEYDANDASDSKDESDDMGSDSDSYTEMPATTMVHEDTQHDVDDEDQQTDEDDHMPSVTVDYPPGFNKHNRRRISMFPQQVQTSGMREERVRISERRRGRTAVVLDTTAYTDTDYVELPATTLGHGETDQKYYRSFPDDNDDVFENDCDAGDVIENKTRLVDNRHYDRDNNQLSSEKREGLTSDRLRGYVHYDDRLEDNDGLGYRNVSYQEGMAHVAGGQPALHTYYPWETSLLFPQTRQPGRPGHTLRPPVCLSSDDLTFVTSRMCQDGVNSSFRSQQKTKPGVLETNIDDMV